MTTITRTAIRVRLALLAAAAVAVLATPAVADDAPKKITYAEHVKPVFRQHCFSCHNQNKKQNDLALDVYESIIEGGASGAVIEPGNLDESYLWALISHSDEPSMPPNQDRIPDDQLALVRTWIEGGALKDAGSKAAAVKPKLDMSVSVGAGRPEGEPIMPDEGLRRQPVVYTPRPGAVTALASAPWAPLVAVGGQQQIVLYDSDSGEMLGILPFPEGIPYVLKFSRSGALLLAGGGKGAYQGLAVVYDVKTGQRVFQVGDELDVVLAADINQDNTRIALGGPQKMVRVYSTEDGSLAYEITKHTEWIYALEFSPDGVLLATGDRAGGLFVWEAMTGREFYNIDAHKQAVTDVSWRGDSNVLASASEDGSIKLWKMEDGKQLKSISAHGGGVEAVEFAHDGRLVSCGRDKVAKTWDTSGNQARQFPALPDLALEAVFTHDGGQVVAGDWSGQVVMWDAEDGSETARLASNPPTLDMLLAELEPKATEAKAAADKAQADLGAAQSQVAAQEAEAKKAGETAAQQAETAKQLAAAAEQARAAVAEAEDKAAAEKAATEAHAKADEAAKAAETAQAKADELAAKVDEAKKSLIQKAVVAKMMADKAGGVASEIASIESEKAALAEGESTPK